MFKVINENSTIGGIIKCCGIWLARDCWLWHARQHCIDEHIADVYILPFKLLPKLDKWCHIYHDHTFICTLPHYLPVASILIAICITLCVMIFVVCKLRCRNKRMNKHKQNFSKENRHENVAENLLYKNQNRNR